jgi:hypothetical protein
LALALLACRKPRALVSSRIFGWYCLNNKRLALLLPLSHFKEEQQMKAYLAEHGFPYDAHAATDDTSEVMFLDEKKWIRHDKLAVSTAKEQSTTGVEGDPTPAMSTSRITKSNLTALLTHEPGFEQSAMASARFVCFQWVGTRGVTAVAAAPIPFKP